MGKRRFDSPRELFDSIIGELKKKNVTVYSTDGDRFEAKTYSGLDGGEIILRGSSSGIDVNVSFFHGGGLATSILEELIRKKYDTRPFIMHDNLNEFSPEQIANNLYTAVCEYERIRKSPLFMNFVQEEKSLADRVTEVFSGQLSK